MNPLSEWNNASVGEDIDLRIAVSNIILELGVPANIKGYFFLREAIVYKVRSPDIVVSMTKVLYPDIAKTFGTTAAKVERAIRHAIEVAWDRNDYAARRKVFSYMASNSEWKPSNSEFIATIVDRIKMHNG